MEHENVKHGFEEERGDISKKLLIVVFIFLILLSPFILGKNDPNVRFNQHYIEGLDHKFNAASLDEKWQYFLSYYTYKLNNMVHRPSNDIDYHNPDEVFVYLFEKLPYYAIVHPTEMYYYYVFELGNQTVSGNFRLVELKDGKLSLGYFDFYSKETEPHHKMYGTNEGLIIKKLSETQYKLTYRGKTVWFKLSDIPFDEPRIRTLPEEDFVTKVRDESGIILYLYYNSKHKAFYYILDQERPITENLVGSGNGILVGDRTGFAYHYNAEFDRYTLFGVSSMHIYVNDYFDGPFDQVYPFLSIRDKIYKVYPYAQASGGIDEHGEYINVESVRIAISPYVKYVEINELNERLTSCKGRMESESELWSCLSYEKKRDFHKDSPAFNEDGTLNNFK